MQTGLSIKHAKVNRLGHGGLIICRTRGLIECGTRTDLARSITRLYQKPTVNVVHCQAGAQFFVLLSCGPQSFINGLQTSPAGGHLTRQYHHLAAGTGSSGICGVSDRFQSYVSGSD